MRWAFFGWWIGWMVVLASLPASAQSFELHLRDCGEWQLRHSSVQPDSASAAKQLRRWIQQSREQGFLAANFDTLDWYEGGVTACLYLGPRFEWAQLQLNQVPAEFLAAAGLRRLSVAEQYVSIQQIDEISEKLLVLAENQGHPFAQLHFDSLQIEGNQVSTQLRLELGPLIRYDSLRLAGNLRLHPKTLSRYLQIKEGAVYNEAQLQRLANRINALPFARSSQSPQLYFYNNKASLVVHAENRRVNNFDGMLGVFPGADNGRLLLTGDLNLQLWSTFRRGEFIGFNWRSLQPGTQDLRTRLRWPFLFNTPVGTDVDFRLFRRDSSFLEVQAHYGLEYTFAPGTYLKGFWQQRNYRLLGSALSQANAQAQVDGSVYGLEYGLQRLDQAFNPYRGFSFSIGLATGNRSTAARLPGGEFAENQQFDQLQLFSEGQIFLPWRKRWQTVLQWNARWLRTEQLYFNELYRIGGFKTLKGFDEESVFASSFAIANLEQRFLLDNNSWLYLFWNGGWLENRAIGQNYTDRPYGLGAGLTFQTNAGIFAIAYALGAERNNALDLRNTKVHLGYRYLL